jgi:hypothetical protein
MSAAPLPPKCRLTVYLDLFCAKDEPTGHAVLSRPVSRQFCARRHTKRRRGDQERGKFASKVLELGGKCDQHGRSHQLLQGASYVQPDYPSHL